MDEDDILYGNISASIWSKLDLMNSRISVIDLSKFNFSKKKVDTFSWRFLLAL